MYPTKLTIKYKTIHQLSTAAAARRSGSLSFARPGTHWWRCSLAQKPPPLLPMHSLPFLFQVSVRDSESSSSSLRGCFSALETCMLFKDIFVASNRNCNVYMLSFLFLKHLEAKGLQEYSITPDAPFLFILSAPASCMYISFSAWCLSYSKLAETGSPTSHILEDR